MKIIEDLSTLSDQELLSQFKECKSEVARWHTFQLAAKVNLNSAYGSIGNEYFRWYDERMAEAITLSGQMVIRWIESKVNEFLNLSLKTTDVNYCIASDTDSLYLNLEPIVKKLCKDPTDKDKCIEVLDKFCSTIIEPFLDKQFKKIAEYTNSFSNNMAMDREAIAQTGLWTAKKRYALMVNDMEGVRYQQPKLKIMGLETQRSSTPEICRDELKEVIRLILTGTEESLQTYISTQKKKWKTLSPEQIAFPRTVNGLGKYSYQNGVFQKGTPIHVRAAMLYNSSIEKYKLKSQYPLVMEGEKIKYLYMKDQNPIGDSVFGFIVDWPKELNLDEFVDYDTQFDKAFMEPVRNILSIIGWSEKKKNSVKNFLFE